VFTGDGHLRPEAMPRYLPGYVGQVTE
jgi:hypothetical protein